MGLNSGRSFPKGALRKPAWELYQDIKRAKREVHVRKDNIKIKH